jgi:hypothetical protein
MLAAEYLNNLGGRPVKFAGSATTVFFCCIAAASIADETDNVGLRRFGM